jgi:ECF sigma factor
MEGNPGEITILLKQWRSGDCDAESKLFELLMPDLRKIARNCFRGERAGHTLQPTALVNEAFFRLAKAKNVDWQDRGRKYVYLLNLGDSNRRLGRIKAAKEEYGQALGVARAELGQNPQNGSARPPATPGLGSG